MQQIYHNKKSCLHVMWWPDRQTTQFNKSLCIFDLIQLNPLETNSYICIFSIWQSTSPYSLHQFMQSKFFIAAVSGSLALYLKQVTNWFIRKTIIG